MTEPMRVTPVAIQEAEDKGWFAGFGIAFLTFAVVAGLVIFLSERKLLKEEKKIALSLVDDANAERDNALAEREAAKVDRDALAVENGRLRRQLFEVSGRPTEPQVE